MFERWAAYDILDLRQKLHAQLRHVGAFLERNLLRVRADGVRDALDRYLPTVARDALRLRRRERCAHDAQIRVLAAQLLRDRSERNARYLEPVKWIALGCLRCHSFSHGSLDRCTLRVRWSHR